MIRRIGGTKHQVRRSRVTNFPQQKQHCMEVESLDIPVMQQQVKAMPPSNFHAVII